MADDPDHIDYVGLIATRWAFLEFIIDSTIWRLANIQSEIGGCLTANLQSIHLKLRSLRALAEYHGASKKLLKDFASFQSRISGTADKRNRAVHHPWMPSVNRDTNEVGMGQFIVRADQKGREFSSKPIAIDKLVELNMEINKRLEEFFKLREKFVAELPAFGKPPPEQPLPSP